MSKKLSNRFKMFERFAKRQSILAFVCLTLQLTLYLSHQPVSCQSSDSSLISTTTLATPLINKLEQANETITRTNSQASEQLQANQVIEPPKIVTQPNSAENIKSVPILSPSIEEKASELSKKYLNLEHFKQHQPQVNSTTTTLAPTASNEAPSRAENSTSIVAERDIEATPEVAQSANGGASTTTATTTTVPITQPPAANESVILQVSLSSSSSEQQPQIQEESLVSRSQQSERFRDHYLRLEDSSATPSAGTNRPRSRQNSSRGLKGFRREQHQSSENGGQQGDNELSQCHQYLQRHSSSPPVIQMNSERLNIEVSKLIASEQQLPCSCDSRLNDDLWLSCDFVQLIGSHLFAPNPIYSIGLSGAMEANSSGGGGGDQSQDSGQLTLLTRFSQRDSGLQILHSQMFHYLQLNYLKSIDLSQNRIRQIKTDAFHGLEHRLEQLDLSNNLLGDSRAVFSERDAPHVSGQVNNGKLIFFSDELNRLKRLSWLSLRANKINQLSPNLLARIGDQSSELRHLDLSDNLLRLVPSSSIAHLDKLEELSLAGNRINVLDQFSKFPKNLKKLDLSNNLISLIRHCDLIDLAGLIELDLSNNQLNQLGRSAFLSSTQSISLISMSNLSPLTPDESESAEERANTGSLELIRQRRQVVDLVRQNGEQVSSKETAEFFGAKDNSKESVELAEDDLSASSSNTNQLEVDDLEASESILSSLVSPSAAAAARDKQQVAQVGDNYSAAAAASEKIRDQFNATLKLNISFNFLENVPGDSLLKFANLQQLDLSNNRIRKLDSNYLCSIYNLVENLRFLDLSGNLLSLDQQQQQQQQQQQAQNQQQNATQANGTNDISASNYQLNKLFGCLQRLERLLLSTNRLGSPAISYNELGARPSDAATMETANGDLDNNGNSDDEMEASASGELGASFASGDGLAPPASSQTAANSNDRLLVRFGESFGSKHLKVLDLSDNQLRVMPLVEQVLSQPANILNATRSANGNPFVTNQLNQWMTSRVRLEELNLNFNSIERLDEHDFELLFDLRSLSFDYNKLSSLPTRLMRRFTSLERLSLNGNRIGQLEPLNEMLERSARSLKSLNLANNRLATWPQITGKLTLTPAADESPASISTSNFHGQEFKQHTREDLTLVSSPSSMSHMSVDQRHLLHFALEELDLSGNLFTSSNVTSLFDQLIHMRSLRRLNLSHNLINKVRSEWFKYANNNLQHLQLTGNKINSIDLGALALNQANELQSLDLDHNLLKELKRKTFESMPKIRELNLGFNLLHTINSETFHQVNSLQVLKLNNNRLTSWKCEYFSNLCNSLTGNINADLSSLLNIPPSGGSNVMSPYVSSLTELDLSHNQLSQLRVNSISVHTKLQKLNLEHNKLSFIPHDLFRASTSSGSSSGRQVQLISSLKYLNLAHNNIQTIDNINFKPLKNLLSLNLSFNELQTLGSDVVLMDSKQLQQEQNSHKVVISNNLTNMFMEDDLLPSSNRTSANGNGNGNGDQRQARNLKTQHQASMIPTAGQGNWPVLSKLRQLDFSNNQLTSVNQSILSELSPFAQLKLNLSFNLLDSESLPAGFFTKVSAVRSFASQQVASSSSNANQNQQQQQQQETQTQQSKQQNAQDYDLIFTLKLESLDLSHNKLNEFPIDLLENHYTSMESCNLAHNRIQNLVANSNMMLHIKSLNLEFNPLSRESSELILFEQRNARSLNLAATRLFAIQQAQQAADLLAHSTGGGGGLYTRHRLANQTSELDTIRSISRQIDAPYLRHMNLSSNQLVWLASNIFDKMHSLQTLDLSNNQLTRLHLLNNQLASVAPTLEYLSMASNLFTNIDANDFGQLIRLRHLDLSNLLSLQKMNCKFLLRLTSLRRLKMINYPQLRQNINNQQANLLSSRQYSDRLLRKLRNELLMSTLGRHCFKEDVVVNSNRDYPFVDLAYDDQIVASSSGSSSGQLKWFNLEELELELFNSFNLIDTQQEPTTSSHSLKVSDELSQLLGPRTRKLTLVGLNVTSISDETLFGVVNEELQLKISYTSLAQLPLKQIFTSVAKRTKLYLDFRNNNIQTIDMNCLQWLDELQQNNRVSPSTRLIQDERPTLRLANNPFRCDCQTRPLWLWLNQRWDTIEMPPSGDSGEASSGLSISSSTGGGGGASDSNLAQSAASNSIYLLKFSAISQSSDMKCYYPQKLRGKLAQHVYYNDLVCKSSGSSSSVAANRQSRKRNETTKSSESHYLTSLYGNEANDNDDLDEDDYLDSESRATNTVKLTKFNRYQPQVAANFSAYFAYNNPAIELGAPGDETGSSMSSANAAELDGLDARMAKRDQNTASRPEDPRGGQPVPSTRYAKHRPNTQQKHAHFSTLSSLGQLGKSLGGHRTSGSTAATKSSFLTESDVMILTLTSVAMTLMSFVIMAICFCKYKMDRSDKEKILVGTQSKLFLGPKGFLVSSGNQISPASSSRSKSSSSSGGAGAGGGGDSSGSKRNSPKSSKKSSDSSAASSAKSKSDENLNAGGNFAANTLAAAAATANKQVLIPIGAHINPKLVAQQTAPAVVVASGDPRNPNFLMRSPTLRRVHGLTSNASDWFKFTLRAYPYGHASRRRRRLFLGESQPPAGVSQLHTAQLDHQFKRQPQPVGTSGCPIHAFRSVRKFQEQSSLVARGIFVGGLDEMPKCRYCKRLLQAIQQTRVQHVAVPTISAQLATGTKVSPPVSQRRVSPSNDSESPRYSRVNKLSSAKAQLGMQVGDAVAAADHVAVDVPDQQQQQRQETEIHLATTIADDGQDDDDHEGQQQTDRYFSPRFIRALARQLDMDENQLEMAKPSRFQRSRSGGGLQNQSGHSSYTSRDQQVRSMRTFGFNNARASTNTLASSQTQQTESVDLNASQIPTVDVDGRFAYQSESLVCSSSAATPTNQKYHLAEPPISRVASYDQSGIFMLIEDSARPTSRNSNSRSRADSQKKIADHLMHDECSHSSSPVAYGFMRSSPSATTISSNTNTMATHNRYVVNESPALDFAFNRRSGNSNTMSTNNESENNNKLDYVINHKPETISMASSAAAATLVAVAGSDATTTQDDQVIISRL